MGIALKDGTATTKVIHFTGSSAAEAGVVLAANGIERGSCVVWLWAACAIPLRRALWDWRAKALGVDVSMWEHPMTVIGFRSRLYQTTHNVAGLGNHQ